MIDDLMVRTQNCGEMKNNQEKLEFLRPSLIKSEMGMELKLPLYHKRFDQKSTKFDLDC